MNHILILGVGRPHPFAAQLGVMRQFGLDPMNDAESLYNIAEIAFTMIGVTGLVATFLSKGELHPLDKLRFVGLVATGFTVAIFAYVPSWISPGGSLTVNVWRNSAILALAVHSVSVPLVYFLTSRTIKEVSPKAFIFLQNTLVALIVALHVSNALSWPFTSSKIQYEITLFAALMYGSLIFVAMVLFRPGKDA